MGYYTRHELTIVKGDNDLIESFREVSEDASYALCSNGDSKESCKWYDHQEELKSFSLLHPEALLKLKGEGEESGDIWEEYYQDVKIQVCKAQIIFADFDPRLLS